MYRCVTNHFVLTDIQTCGVYHRPSWQFI
jgi:hypothetical protein